MTMNAVTLGADGAIRRDGTAADGPLIYLGHQIDLETGYTLRSFFRLFDRYPLLRELSPFLPAYIQQVANSPASGCVYDAFETLELAKTVEMIGFPGRPRLEIYNALRGLAGETRSEIRAVGIEQLLDMGLTLGPLRHVVFGDAVDVFTYETVYTLFEFIDGILWELSFQGTLMACELRR